MLLPQSRGPPSWQEINLLFTLCLDSLHVILAFEPWYRLCMRFTLRLDALHWCWHILL